MPFFSEEIYESGKFENMKWNGSASMKMISYFAKYLGTELRHLFKPP